MIRSLYSILPARCSLPLTGASTTSEQYAQLLEGCGSIRSCRVFKVKLIPQVCLEAIAISSSFIPKAVGRDPSLKCPGTYRQYVPGPETLLCAKIRVDLPAALPRPIWTSAWHCILLWAFWSKMFSLDSGFPTRIVASSPGLDQACCYAKSRLDLPRNSLWESR